MNIFSKSIVQCKLQLNRSRQGELIRQTFQELKDPRIQLTDFKSEALELPKYSKEDDEWIEDVSSRQYQAMIPSGYTVSSLRDPRKWIVEYELLITDPSGCPVAFTRGCFTEARAHWYLEGRCLVGNPDATHEERKLAKERNDKKQKTSPPPPAEVIHSDETT